MTLEERLSAFYNSGIIRSRGSGHAVQPKLVKLTEDAWLGAAVEYYGTFPSVRLNVKGNPIAGIIIAQAFPEIVDVTKDSDNKIAYATNPWVLIEPIQKGTEYNVIGKTNTAISMNQTIQFDGGYAIPTAVGAVEVTTCVCVADVAGSLNSTYFTIQAIDANGDPKDYHVWIDVNSGGTNPAPAGSTGVEIDVATNATAQDVSDAITAALDALDDFGATNVGGTSTTVTITNANNGEVESAIDSEAAATGFTIATTQQGADPGDDIAPPGAVGGICKKAITATASTEKFTIMEGR